MSKRKKIFLFVASFFLLLVITVISVLLWITSAIFDKTPLVSYQRHIPDIAILSKLTQKLSSGSENGTMDISVLLNPTKVMDVLLNEKEINEMISSGLESYATFENDPEKQEILKSLRITFTNGIFVANYSLDSKIWTPFGSFLNIHCEFIPQISEHNISFDIKLFKTGRLSSSVITNRLNSAVEKQINIEKEKKNISDFLDAIEEIRVEGKCVRVKYIPAKLMKIWLKQ